jgi:hypothetical protein
LTELESRNCLICGTNFHVAPISKNRFSKRQTCSIECRRLLCTKNRARWSPEDVQFLSSIAETLPIKRLHNVFNAVASRHKRPLRSINAIKSKLAALGYSIDPRIGYFTLSSLGRVLDCHPSTIRHWCKVGLEYTQKSKQPGSLVHIQINDLKAFARKRPELFGGFDRINLFIALEDTKLVERILEQHPTRNRGIRAPQPVRCIETGKVYNSYIDAGKDYFISSNGIYKAVLRKSPVNGHHFERINP